MTQDQALKILKSGRNVYLGGEPGAGKSYTVNLFTKWLKENRTAYVVAAPTGIAATHVNGITIHGLTANIDLSISRREMTQEDIAKIAVSKNSDYEESYTARRLKYVQVIIIDEVSMVSALVLHNLDRILRYYNDPKQPFGGKQIVLVGDFFQLPPIVDEDVSHKLGEKKAYDAPQWDEAEFVECYLTEQHRQSEPKFIEILRKTRDGKVTDAHIEALLNTGKNTHHIPPTELYPTNKEADKRNADEYAALTGEELEFEMREQGNPVAIKNLKKHCLSPEVLRLKVGTVVMLTRNAYVKPEGRSEAPIMLYANGEIGVVSEFNFLGQPVVETAEGRLIYPQMAEWNDEHSGKRGGNGVSSIFQLPLKHAWAITIHKSQGMSLSAAKIDLRRDFEYGMGYVAVSRVRSMSGLAILGMRGKASLEVDPKVSKKDAEFRKASKQNENL